MRWVHRCICMVLGSLLGCSGDDPTSPEPEYGVQPVKVMLSGDVKQDITNLPVPDIEVRLAGVDTVQTNAQGQWIMTSYTADAATVAQEVLQFVDVDGLVNLGEFMPMDYPLDPANIIDDVYVESDIDVHITDDPVAEYGPPPATNKTDE
jgi:hypothetical protein